MMKPWQYAAQAAVYGLFAVTIGYFADTPSYTHMAPDKAQILLTFAHGGDPITECRRRTREELKDLAANMRKLNVCPRERVPLKVQLSLDGNVIYEDVLPPTGLRKDNPSKTYQKFIVPAGRHTVVAKLRDSRRTEGFDHESTRVLDLKPGQNLSIDFKPSHGGFVYE